MAELNSIIHQPVRLKIMSALVALGASDQVEFTYLRKLLKLTDGNLGAHLAKLEEARYIKIEKAFVERKPRTYFRVTGRGRDAFADHVDALKRIIKGK